MTWQEWPHIEAAMQYTEDKLAQLRTDLTDCLAESDAATRLTIVATGSYGRGEASDESDLDFYLLYDGDGQLEDRIPAELISVDAVISRHVSRSAGDTETFGANARVRFEELISPIGGSQETNLMLTRRMLFLLEGTWLFGEERFREYRRALLKKYLPVSCPEGRIYRFFLNDVIRYYRTMTTDFQYKVVEKGKSWGVRNIKLKFSRKMLFFGGVMAIAELTRMPREESLEKAEALLDRPVLRRLRDIGDDSAVTREILRSYDDFLKAMTDPRIRDLLDQVTEANRNEVDQHKWLRAQSDDFSQALGRWLTEHYDAEHPIHHSLLF